MTTTTAATTKLNRDISSHTLWGRQISQKYLSQGIKQRDWQRKTKRQQQKSQQKSSGEKIKTQSCQLTCLTIK